MQSRGKAAGALLVAAAGTLAVSVSGYGGTASASSRAARPALIAGPVPARAGIKKTLTVAADATYPPNEFIASNGHTVVGMDPDLGHALGKVMGVTFNFVNATFDTIIPGLQSGKYDLGMSSFTDSKAREKVLDFVTYFSAGTSFYVKATGGPTINSLADLCGHTVATERGTTQATDALAQNGKCKKSGKPGVTAQVYPDQNSTNLAVSSGRAQVGMADSPVAAYVVKKSEGQFKVTGKPYNTAPYGIAIPKGSGLAKPILAALKKLIANGTYEAILKKWGIQAGAIKTPKINGATS